jgi:hypothetical protein
MVFWALDGKSCELKAENFQKKFKKKPCGNCAIDTFGVRAILYGDSMKGV